MGKDTFKEICGDGKVFFQYPCDDGNLVNGDGCSSTCTIEPHYTCYGGDNTHPDKCYPICGDGVLIAPEACDDSNIKDDDG
jgi:cysteine-rich repeat protein